MSVDEMIQESINQRSIRVGERKNDEGVMKILTGVVAKAVHDNPLLPAFIERGDAEMIEKAKKEGKSVTVQQVKGSNTKIVLIGY